MELQRIREQLSDQISQNEIWDEKLTDTNPGNYGWEGTDLQISADDIFANIPNKTFTFKNADLSFTARIGGSSDNDSMMMDFSKIASGSGTFEFTDKDNIVISEIEADVDLDLFSED